MNFSLYSNGHYVQSSNELKILMCNAATLASWCTAMSIESFKHSLVIRDNTEDKVVATSNYLIGSGVRWKKIK